MLGAIIAGVLLATAIVATVLHAERVATTAACREARDVRRPFYHFIALELRLAPHGTAHMTKQERHIREEQRRLLANLADALRSSIGQPCV